MTKKPKGPLETVPIEKSPVEPHDYDGNPATDRCRVCQTPGSNRLHDPAKRRQDAHDHQAAHRAWAGERED